MLVARQVDDLVGLPFSMRPPPTVERSPHPEGSLIGVAAPTGPPSDTGLDIECCNAYSPLMPKTLREELRQGKPFRSLREEALLSIARTEAIASANLERVLAPHGLSMTQYNVLRILRGAGPDGLCRNDIGARLISRMPDVSRLLDRMEAAGLVSRVRSTEDRRLVNTTLTKQGRALVDRLDAVVSEYQDEQIGHMTKDQLRTLVDLLNLARSPS